jgi:ribosomal protein S18 acetylase RimI-like enzyme
MKVEYRHPTEADAEDIAQVVNRSNREVKHYTDTNADDVLTWTFKEKDFDPKGYLLAFMEGQAVAYAGAMIYKTSIEAGNNHAYANLSIIPEFRCKGIEEHLMDFVSGYLRSKGIASMRLWVSREFAWKMDIAARAGMADVRHSYLMACAGKERPDEPGIPEGYNLHHIMMTETSDADLNDLVNILNDSFSESWSFYPAELEDFLKDRDEERRTGDTKSRLTFAKTKSQVVGICGSSIRKDYNLQHDARAGWSRMLGVGKAHRRSGLGRALLADSMAWLWAKGMDTLYLGVDAENAKALKLYNSLGYIIEQESIIYELKL